MRLRDLSRRLQARNPQVRLVTGRERLSALGARLAAARTRRLERERERLGRDRERRAALSERAGRALGAVAAQKRAELERAVALLEGLGYQATLERGFAVVLDASGRLVKRVADAPAQTRLVIRLGDGAVRAISEGGTGGDGVPPSGSASAQRERGAGDASAGRPGATSRNTSPPDIQGGLFD